MVLLVMWLWWSCGHGSHVVIVVVMWLWLSYGCDGYGHGGHGGSVGHGDYGGHVVGVVMWSWWP